tara:strand:- start:378081 stop:379046 length:966 start_codon:yes stop_codon:yes gene_type:complete
MTMIDQILEILGWWLAATLFASFSSALIYPFFCRLLAQSGASLRASARLAFVAAAPLAAALAVALITQSSLASLMVPAHCHADQCGVHAPAYPESSLLLIGLAAVSSLVVGGLFMVLLWALYRAYQRLSVLLLISQRSAEGYRTIDSEEVLACCVGLWRPEILLSRGLIERLQPHELAVVLEHERAHVTRQDNLRSLAMSWATLFWPTAVRHRVLHDYRADTEQACDLMAARAGAGEAQVAAVIRKLDGLSAGSRSDRGSGFACDDAAARINALQYPGPRQGQERRGLYTIVSGLALNWCLLVYCLTALSHPVIEWLGAGW